MHAFIIDDDYLISQSIADMLGNMGFTRFGFARSEDAAILGASGKERIDLITADAKLLPGDGVKAVEIICKHKKIPVIFVTGYADELDGRLISNLKDACVLTKPVNKEDLAKAVRKAIGKR